MSNAEPPALCAPRIGIAWSPRILRCATHLTARASGLALTALRPPRHPRGKAWPPQLPSLEFNLSHAGEVALIVLARPIRPGVDVDVDVDVDVEMLACGTDWRSIAQHYSSPGERQAIGHGEGVARRFYALWTAKEAVLKAVGSGLDGLREVVIALDADERPCLLSDALGARNLLAYPRLVIHPPGLMRGHRVRCGIGIGAPPTRSYPSGNQHGRGSRTDHDSMNISGLAPATPSCCAN